MTTIPSNRHIRSFLTQFFKQPHPAGQPLAVQLSSGKKCDDFIYPILDWGNQPLVAALTVASGAILIPFVHLFWTVVTYIRKEIFSLVEHKFRR